MSTIAFIYDEIPGNSEYINTRLDDGDIALTPEVALSKNLSDWELTGTVTIEDGEVADIDNTDSSSRYVSRIINADQQSVGDILVRVMVEAVDVPGSPGSGWGLYADIRHHDDTWEYSKSVQFPTGIFTESQFQLTLHSDAGKTIEWIYVYMYMNNREGHAKFRRAEVIDFTVSDISDVGEAYSKHECIYEPTKLASGAASSALKLEMMPFMYGNLADLGDQGSPAHAISIFSQYPSMVCGEPGTLSANEIIVTDGIKVTVSIFGYISMGELDGNPLPDLADLEAAIDRIADAGWYGVFIDCCGYDFNETRARQNSVINYTHGKGLIAFANAWFVDDILGNEVDVDHNPGGVATAMTTDDWYLLESFYTSGSEYRDLYPLLEKCSKCRDYKDSLGVKMSVLPYKRDAVAWGDEETISDAEMSYLLALAYGFDAWWFPAALENNAFAHADDPNFSVGSAVITSFTQLKPYQYVYETDRYIIVFDAYSYSPFEYTAYDKGKIRTLPVTPGLFEYSAGMDTWSTTRSSTSKWVREKLTFT